MQEEIKENEKKITPGFEAKEALYALGIFALVVIAIVVIWIL